MSNIEQMRAVVCHGPQDYRVENIAKPVAGPNELIVKIAACGICAGDCKAYHGAPMFWKGVEPWVKAPVVPGHEFFGTVVEMGPGASEFHCVEMGDLVVAEQIVPCGKCKFCRSGKYWMCEVHNIFGFQQHVAEGGLSEYMRYPANAIVHKIPKTMSLQKRSSTAFLSKNLEKFSASMGKSLIGKKPLGRSSKPVIKNRLKQHSSWLLF